MQRAPQGFFGLTDGVRLATEVSELETPKGKTYLHMLSSGDVTATDAEGLMKSIAPGTPNAGLPILAVVMEGAKFSAEARQAFTKMNADGAQQ